MTDIHALSGAYALDAVDDLERAAFERHLRECASCAQEVRELTATVARLADEAATAPPPRMREAVLTAVSRTPQARPGQPGRPAREPSRDVTRWRRFAAAAVAAGVVAVGAGFGTWTVADQRVKDARAQATAEREKTRDIERVLAAPDAHLFGDEVSGTGRLNVTVAPSLNMAVVRLAGLPALDREHVYQMWLIRGTTPTSVLALKPGETSATFTVPNVEPADQLGITVEKAPKAERPNLPPVKAVVLR